MSESYFDLLGVVASAGRTLGQEEGLTAVLSHALARRLFGGASESLGRALELNGVPVAVVGWLRLGSKASSCLPLYST